MRRPEPRLQRKLLAWLLGPLAVLLVLDTAVAYWNTLRVSDLAYDRALYEIGREIALHVRLDGDGRGSNCRKAPPRSCCWTRTTCSSTASSATTVRLWEATCEMPAPLPSRASGPPHFYSDTVHGEPARMMVAWMPASESAGAPRSWCRWPKPYTSARASHGRCWPTSCCRRCC